MNYYLQSSSPHHRTLVDETQEKKKEPLTITQWVINCLRAWHRQAKIQSSYQDSSRNISLNNTRLEHCSVKELELTRCNVSTKRVSFMPWNQVNIQGLQDITSILNCTQKLKVKETGFKEAAIITNILHLKVLSS